MRKLINYYRPKLYQWGKFVNRFIPHHAQPDTPEYLRYQCIIALSFIIGGSGFPFIFLFFIMGHTKPAVVVFWSFIIFSLIIWATKRGSSVKKTAYLLSINYYQCHLCLALLFGGVSAPNTMWLIALPLISILTGGISFGFMWGMISTFSITGLYLIEFLQYMEFHKILAPAEELFIRFVSSIGLTLAVLGSAIAYEILKNLALDQHKQAEYKLLEANQELKTLDAQKTAFFQNISHELRTPLTLILHPLEEAYSECPQQRDLAIALKNTWRLLRLVNQLLEFQKLSAGQRKIKREAVNLYHFIHICGEYIRPACQAKGIDVRITHNQSELINPQAISVWLDSEVDALEKIIFNFVSNAFKFTESGGSIEIGLLTNDHKIRVFVRDTGQGISIKDQAKLFKVFTQVDDSTTRAHEGSGLGLALVKSLAEELDAQVGVDSEMNRGSCFWIEFLCESSFSVDPIGTLPQATHSSTPFDFTNFSIKKWLFEGAERFNSHKPQSFDSEDRSEKPSISPPTDLQQNSIRILVIDDLSDMRNLIMRTLKRAGYEVFEAADGHQGLELARKISPHLIITDWMMPEMSGPELIATLRSDTQFHKIPVILLTAKSDEESKRVGTEIGADAFLGKPFNKKKLLGSINALLK